MKSSSNIRSLSKNLSPARWAGALMIVLCGLSLSQAQTTVITFEEPALVTGHVAAVTKGGVTVHFITPARIFRPDVATQSPPNALANDGQDMNDETGFQKPFIFEFDHLQRRVRVSVGLNMNDPSLAGFSDPSIEARLFAYDAGGNQIAMSRQPLGAVATPIGTSLEVQVPGDSIQRVKLEFSGNVAEVLDNLEFEAGSTTPVTADTVRPVIVYLSPASGGRINSRTVRVQGRVLEANGLSLIVNGVTTPVRRSDAFNYEFITTLTLPEGSSRIDVRAIDDAGNVGELYRDLDLRIPASFRAMDLRFTQSGLLDAGALIPTRLVAKKTGLFRLAPQIRTADGRETFVDSAQINVLSGSITVATFPGQRRLASGSFAPYGSDLADGQRAYFFIDGRRLMPRYAIHFVLQLFVQGRMVYEERLGGEWNFPIIQGLSLLIAPQQHPLDADQLRALMNIMANFGRIYPVPDGVVSLNNDEFGGIRFAILPPTDYTGHTDPNDPAAPFSAAVAYDQGFLLHDHNVANGPGADTDMGTRDDSFTLWRGEYITTNQTNVEDANRNGRFDEDELARVRGGLAREILVRRMANWRNFVTTNAESQRQSWNRARGLTQQSRRAIAVLTTGDPSSSLQNRTGLLGTAGYGETAFWLSVDLGENNSLPHEVGHTWGLARTVDNHTNNDVITCDLSGEAINLLAREVINPGLSLMCSWVADSRNHFLTPMEYNELYDRLLAGEEQRIAASSAPMSPATGSRLAGQQQRSSGFSPLQSLHHQQSKMGTSPGGQQSFVLIGTLTSDDKANVFESYMSPVSLPLTAEAKDSTYTVAFLDGKGASLTESPFGVSFQSPDLPVKLGSTTFSIVRPLPSGTAVVQLRKQGRMLANIVRSEHAPVLTNVTIKPSKETEGLVNVQWEGSDADGDALTYAVGYSIDQGKSFIPLRGGLTVSSLSFSPYGLAGSRQALIQVMASDGFNAIEANSAPFALPTAAPAVFILAPDSKTMLAPEESIILRGAALDAEDGMLSEKSLRWFLIEANGTRPLGDGSEATIKGLPAGKYTLRLTATDHDGEQASDERSFVIRDTKLTEPFAANQPEVATNQPKVAANQPEATTKQPEVGTNQSKVDTNQPEVAANQARPETSLPFQVTGVSLNAVPQKYSGQCPTTIKFIGEITANSKGTVKYIFIRSDGASGQVQTLDFNGAGSKEMGTTWTLGGPGLMTYDGWQAIRILSPNVIESDKASFVFRCQ